MPWPGRRSRKAKPSDERLPDLDFLALVRDSLEELDPGVTAGSNLKGNSLSSPRGWAVGVLPPYHDSGNHYDIVALPDTSVQNESPMFMDCAVALPGRAPDAARTWTQTAGACLLELLDPRGRFADHWNPDDERGVPGCHLIESGMTGFGLDPAESRRLQAAIAELAVPHRLANHFADALESPFFNGVKVFYGGAPGSMQAEIRVNGERHEGASAAFSALGLPEPSVFTMVRGYSLLIPEKDGG